MVSFCTQDENHIKHAETPGIRRKKPDAAVKREFLQQCYQDSKKLPRHLKEAVGNYSEQERGYTTPSLAKQGYLSILQILWLQWVVPGILSDLCKFSNKRANKKQIKGWKYLNSSILGMVFTQRITMGAFYYGNINDYWNKDKDIALGLVNKVMKQPPYTLIARNICQYDIDKDYTYTDPNDTIYKV